jgi:hypothetical protein
MQQVHSVASAVLLEADMSIVTDISAPGPKPTSRSRWRMSAFGGKADIATHPPNVRFASNYGRQMGPANVLCPSG